MYLRDCSQTQAEYQTKPGKQLNPSIVHAMLANQSSGHAPNPESALELLTA